jgi:hypothetical protein
VEVELEVELEVVVVVVEEEEEEETERAWTKLKKYCPNKLCQHVNSFFKGREKWVQHAKNIFSMAHFHHLLIGFGLYFSVILFLRSKSGHRLLI